MPCGGIYPTLTERDAKCWACNKPGPDCFMMEWDAHIHSKCVEDFLYTDEGDIILNHGHFVAIKVDGVDTVLFPERMDGKPHPSLRDVAIAAGRVCIEHAKDPSSCYFCPRSQDDGGDDHDEECPLAPLNPPREDIGEATARPGDAPQGDESGG